MTVLPDARVADARVSDLYRRNVTQLGDRDIVIASHGGSGQSLIGNILAELGLNYVDAYTETLHPDGTAEVADEHLAYRQHLASQHGKDSAIGARPTRLWPRFVKTHHPPSVFAAATVGAVWILVRDPRDAIYASYKWRADFGEEEWDKVPGTFEEWLSGPGDFSPSPVDDWPAFYTAWAQRAPEAEVLRFEDLKTHPAEVVTGVLRRAGLEIDDAAIEAAVEASSFTKMRAHEDQVSGSAPRVIREGRTNGWQRWMNPTLEPFFTGPDLHTAAAGYGYDIPS
jgi:hypothetical protein